MDEFKERKIEVAEINNEIDINMGFEELCFYKVPWVKQNNAKTVMRTTVIILVIVH